jgi:hypothetical protein
MTVSSFVSFAELFSFKETQQSLYGVQNITWADFKMVFDKIFTEIMRGHRMVTADATTPVHTRDINSFDRILVVCLHLISLFVRMKSTVDEDLVRDITTKVYYLMKFSPVRSCSIKSFFFYLFDDFCTWQFFFLMSLINKHK